MQERVEGRITDCQVSFAFGEFGNESVMNMSDVRRECPGRREV